MFTSSVCPIGTSDTSLMSKTSNNVTILPFMIRLLVKQTASYLNIDYINDN